jgi:hypothetical protein
MDRGGVDFTGVRVQDDEVGQFPHFKTADFVIGMALPGCVKGAGP